MTVAANGTNHGLNEAQLGPAERLLSTLLNGDQHLWHNGLGIERAGKWVRAQKGAKASDPGVIKPGLYVPAAVELYSNLLEIYRINPELSARFACYAIFETEWHDLKIACAALMLAQERSGRPVLGADGKVEFYDDDYRAVGQGMFLHHSKTKDRAMKPKSVLRVAELLELPEIAALNRRAGFGDPNGNGVPRSRWKLAAQRWLEVRETNVPIFDGLLKHGYKGTVMSIARKCRYKPQSQSFYEKLGWRQKQADGAHRTVGMGELKLAKRESFEGLSEADICQRIVEGKLSYKEVVGRLPKGVGLTPAVMVACLPSLSDKDLRILTPTLEDLGLLKDAEVKARWDKAIERSTDQRGLNILKNVRSQELKTKLEDAADNAAKKAVAKASEDVDLRLMFLIDKSGSMAQTLERSKEALTRILAGFPPDKVHIATFDTMGTVLKPKAPTRAGVQDMLRGINGGGGTLHYAAVRAIFHSGVRFPKEAHLVVIVAGDEGGETGEDLAATFGICDYKVAAMGHIVEPANRGRTIRDCAKKLGVPYSEIDVSKFDDPYHVPRALQALLEAPLLQGSVAEKRVERVSLVEKVMKTPLLLPDGRVAKEVRP